MRIGTTAVIALLAAAASLGAADARRPLTAEDVVALPQVADPRLSPGGDRVAFVVTRLSAPRERASEVWLVGTDGQGLERLPLPQARAPRWSPDGRTLAVVANAPGGAAVHLVTLADRSARVLDGTGGAREATFSPDGQRLAFLRQDPEPPGTDPVVVDQGPMRHTRLWIADLPGGAPRKLMADDVTVWRFSWSPDSRRIAVLASASPLAEGLEYGSRLLSVDATSGALRVLADKTSPQSAPVFSPDGRSITYLAPLGAFKERGALQVVAAGEPLDGGLPVPRALAAEYAGTFFEAAFSGDGRRVMAALGAGAEHALAAVGLDGAVERLVPMRHSIIPLWEPVWSMDASGRRVAYVSETEGGREVFTATLDGAAPQRLTRFTAPLEGARLGSVEAVRWSNGKSEVEGILVSPAEARGRTPLLVWLHGGPAYHWALGAQVQSWAQLFAARGFRVLLPNFRGSTGYGQAWLTANVRDWGEGPMGDVMSGVDAMVARGLADEGRLYLGGGSYGGYLTYWMVGHTSRFRAAYLRAGISDPLSAYPLTDEPSFFSGYMGGSAYDDPEAYRRLAPLGAVNAVRTPLLIVHGEEDARVPLMQSHLFHAALRQRAVPTQLVVYPREGHSITEYAHQLDHLQRILDWYARY